MICEDDPDLLNLFRMAFKSKYNVIPVNSGKGCIKRFIEETNRNNKIHLLLLDYRLGDMSGESVARKIKEYNGTKIILISGYDVDNSLLKELEENKYIARYVKKPIYLSSLTKLVEETLRK
jgi:response regulator RpfG family c-di-GMP phosphodiesterase